MRLTIPEPKIKLYEDGFAEHDKLSRKSTGDKLSELVERIDDPLVIALDGAWGSGKSLFLKCWVGEHLKREEKMTKTVYFDAFKHDFLDDPLIALTGAIAERFEEADDKTALKAWEKAKQVAPALGRALLRTGVSVATAGLLTQADDLAESAINTVSDELDGAVAEFWKRENGKRAAMEGFRKALRDLTDSDGDGTPKLKLIVVVDELDRCRPDYALSLLEIIKHFFDVPGVNFVLGVNLEQLQNSVKTRYGSGTEAGVYLQKFYSHTIKLPAKIQFTKDYLYYFNYAFRQMQLPTASFEAARSILEQYNGETPMTLRTVQRILSVLALVPPDAAKNGHRDFIVVAVFLKVCAPNIYKQMRMNYLTIDDLKAVFDLKEYDINIWARVLHAAAGDDATYVHSERLISQTLLPDLCEDYLETFNPVELQID